MLGLGPDLQNSVRPSLSLLRRVSGGAEQCTHRLRHDARSTGTACRMDAGDLGAGNVMLPHLSDRRRANTRSTPLERAISRCPLLSDTLHAWRGRYHAAPYSISAGDIRLPSDHHRSDTRSKVLGVVDSMLPPFGQTRAIRVPRPSARSISSRPLLSDQPWSDTRPSVRAISC